MAKRLFVVMGFVVVATITAWGQSKPSIQGVWRVSERTTVGPNGTTNKNPQPSLWIFTGKHYSIVQDNSAAARQGLEGPPPEQPTDAQMIAAYREWAPVTANSGTYEFTGGMLNLRATVAKNSSVTRTKTGLSYQVKTDGASLVLTSVIGPTGQTTTNPVTMRLVRVE